MKGGMPKKKNGNASEKTLGGISVGDLRDMLVENNSGAAAVPEESNAAITRNLEDLAELRRKASQLRIREPANKLLLGGLVLSCIGLTGAAVFSALQISDAQKVKAYYCDSDTGLDPGYFWGERRGMQTAQLCFQAQIDETTAWRQLYGSLAGTAFALWKSIGPSMYAALTKPTAIKEEHVINMAFGGVSNIAENLTELSEATFHTAMARIRAEQSIIVSRMKSQPLERLYAAIKGLPQATLTTLSLVATGAKVGGTYGSIAGGILGSVLGVVEGANEGAKEAIRAAANIRTSGVPLPREGSTQPTFLELGDQITLTSTAIKNARSAERKKVSSNQAAKIKALKEVIEEFPNDIEGFRKG
jgi:hypothetical protein